MALVEGCKHELEITVPVEEIQAETEKVVGRIRLKAQLPGFRPGKAPVSLIRTRFKDTIRQEVLDELLPKAFRRRADEEKLQVVSTPNVTDLHFHEGEPMRFKAEFEVAPEFELGQVEGLEVEYTPPAVTDEDIQQRLDALREQKADYVNEDPRPLQDGDYAAITLDNLTTGGEPSDVQVQIGGGETLPAFTEALRGVSPGETREFDVPYPEDFGVAELAGKTVQFRATVKSVRRKELPALDDAFAQDLGDFANIDALRDAVRQAIFRERDYTAQQEAKNKLVEKLIDMHDFPLPEAYVDRQIQSQVENRLRNAEAEGVDVRKLKLDWTKVKDSLRDRALKEVRGSLLLEKVADQQNIQATEEEIDFEVQRLARQEREPVAALRPRLQKQGILDRIAAHIRTEKTLQYLFDKAQHVAPTTPPAEPAPSSEG